MDFSTWLTKQEAADRIGVSTKTVEALAKERKIEQGRWRRDGRGNEFSVYNPDDVARIAAQRRLAPAPFVLPAVPTSNGNGHGGIARTAPDAEAQQALAAGLSAFAAALRSLAPNPENHPQNPENFQKLFLTVPEAAEVSGLSVTFLKRSIAAGSLAAARDGRRWKIRRRDLEQL